jgi:hypothetical protein
VKPFSFLITASQSPSRTLQAPRLKTFAFTITVRLLSRAGSKRGATTGKILPCDGGARPDWLFVRDAVDVDATTRCASGVVMAVATIE